MRQVAVPSHVHLSVDLLEQIFSLTSKRVKHIASYTTCTVGPLLCNTVGKSSKTGTVLLRNSNITCPTVQAHGEWQGQCLANELLCAAGRSQYQLLSWPAVAGSPLSSQHCTWRWHEDPSIADHVFAIHFKSFTKTVMYGMQNTASKINKSFKFWMLVFDSLLDLSHDCLVYIRSISHKCDKLVHRNVALMELLDHSWHYFVSFSMSKKQSIECKYRMLQWLHCE